MDDLLKVSESSSMLTSARPRAVVKDPLALSIKGKIISAGVNDRGIHMLVDGSFNRRLMCVCVCMDCIKV